MIKPIVDHLLRPMATWRWRYVIAQDLLLTAVFIWFNNTEYIINDNDDFNFTVAMMIFFLNFCLLKHLFSNSVVITVYAFSLLHLKVIFLRDTSTFAYISMIFSSLKVTLYLIVPFAVLKF